MFNLYDYIKQEMDARGITHYKVVPEHIDLYHTNTLVDLTKNIYLFVSQDIDVQIPVKVELISFDNYYVFTKTVLQTSFMSQYQFFSQQLEKSFCNFFVTGFVEMSCSAKKISIVIRWVENIRQIQKRNIICMKIICNPEENNIARRRI